jgi:hypothetical protein
MTWHAKTSNQRVLSTLKSVAVQLQLLKKVAAAEARGEIH